MAHYENESLTVSNKLDDLGYGESMISFRRHMIKKFESVLNNRYYNKSHTSIIIAGSKAEGLAVPFENDLDVMQVILDVICNEDSRILRHEEEVQKFQLEMNYTSPGYTLLRNVNIRNSVTSHDFLCEMIMCQGPNKYYISSDLCKDTLMQVVREESHLPGNHGHANVDNETHGPSVTTKVLSNPKDQVLALTCECPTYLTAWKCRQRPYQWPPNNVVREVSSLESYVVPVGPTTSSIRFLEWRICFTKGEIRLVHSLNDCLTKVLYLLKQIAKVTLKPISKDISSYIVKNTVFWLAELNDHELFVQRNLILVLRKGLTYLKRFILANFLPSYMIPQRNLFEGKLTHQQRNKLCMRIDSLLKEGPSVVMKCAKVKSAHALSEMELRRFSEILHREEIMFFLYDYTLSCRLPVGNTPVTLVDIVRSICSDDVTRFIFKQYLLSKGLSHDEVEEVVFELDDDFPNVQ